MTGEQKNMSHELKSLFTQDEKDAACGDIESAIADTAKEYMIALEGYMIVMAPQPKSVKIKSMLFLAKILKAQAKHMVIAAESSADSEAVKGCQSLRGEPGFDGQFTRDRFKRAMNNGTRVISS